MDAAHTGDELAGPPQQQPGERKDKVGVKYDSDPDDYGLPRVDIIVPDDARELDREILAYHREERRRRRRMRWQRLTGPFLRHGMVMPIIIGALVIALTSGTVITMVGPKTAPRVTGGPIADRPSARPGQIGGVLPEAQVGIPGQPRKRLIDLRPAVLVIVPAGCRCASLIDELSKQTMEYRIGLYLIADRRNAKVSIERSAKEMRKLAGAARHTVAIVAQDDKAVLATTYQATGLTAVLVHTDGVVDAVLYKLRPGMHMEKQLEQLQN